MIAMKAVLPTRIGDAIGARISGGIAASPPREPDASEKAGTNASSGLRPTSAIRASNR